jgi:hypothetical protein
MTPLLVALALLSAAPEQQTASVGFVGDGYVYLDKGLADGLAVGTKVRVLQRRKRRAGVCVVEALSQHSARCAGQLKAGPRSAVFRADPPAGTPPPTPLPALPADVAQGAAKALSELSFTPVPFTGERGRPPFRFPVRVSARTRSWLAADRVTGLGGPKTFHRQVVTLAVRGAPLYVDGLRLFANGEVVGAAVSPMDARFRRREPARLNIWRASVRYRPDGGIFSVEAGRMLPFRAPGARLVDGMSASLRLLDDRVELGAYAGLAPEASRLYPRVNTYAAATYAAVDWSLGDVALSARGRLGASANLALQARGEAEVALAGGWSRYLQGAAGVRTVIESQALLAPWVDLAYAELWSTPGYGLRFSTSYRYNARAFPSFDLGMPAGGAPGAFGFHHANLNAGWEPIRFVGARLLAGGAFDHGAFDWRAWAGPEVGVPDLFGTSAWIGYREEIGTFPARMVTLSGATRVGGVLSVRAGVWAVQRPGINPMQLDETLASLGDPLHETHGWGGIDVDAAGFGLPLPVSELRLSGLFRGQMSLPSVVGRPRSSLSGLDVTLGVSGAM